MRAKHAAWAAGAMAMVLSGCAATSGSPPGDKAGGDRPVVTLTLGTVDPQGRPDTPTVKYFVARLEALSHGSVHVDVRWDSGNDYANGEQGIAKQVQSERMDLGWVGSRAFDTMGVTSLRAVQAPFLITDNRLTRTVAEDAVAATMLAGLTAAGLVGLGLYPDQLRHPVGFGKPLTSLADFRGARVRTPISNTSDAVLRALGAEPVHLNGGAYDRAIADHAVDGVDASLGLAPDGSFVTGNVTFYPRMNVLFGSKSGLADLDRSQRSALDRAARETLGHAVDSLPDAEDPTPFCGRGGTVVIASDAEVTAMRQATRRVYTKLEADPATKSAIDRIRALAGQFAPAPATTSCSAALPTTTATTRLLVPDGTYTAVATKADALRLGVRDECALKADGNHLRLELEDGLFEEWQGCSIRPEQVGSHGRFTVTKDTFTTSESCVRCGETYFDWSFDGHFLTLKVRGYGHGGPLDPVGQLITDHRWQKVG